MIDEILLITLGLLAGLMSGFTGTGGGIILISLLLLVGYSFQPAIGISIFQMFFASLYGTFLDVKKYNNIFKTIIVFGISGFCGGIFGGFAVSIVPVIYLKYVFIIVLLYSIYTLITKNKNKQIDMPMQEKDITKKGVFFTVFIFGFFIGVLGMSIGIGGGFLIIPFANMYLRYNLKKASAVSLAFIIFSSFGGVISHSETGNILFFEAGMVTIGSLIGVYCGLKLKDIVHINSYTKYLLALNIIILGIISYKTF